jgi:Flp pilus assembly protein TadB
MMLALRVFRIIVPLTALCLLALLLVQPDLLPHSLLPIVVLTIALGQWLRSRAKEASKLLEALPPRFFAGCARSIPNGFPSLALLSQCSE